MLWQESDDRKMSSGELAVYLPKDSGSLCVLHLKTMNQSLLCKWLRKLENTDGIWQTMLKSKYLQKQVSGSLPSGHERWTTKANIYRNMFPLDGNLGVEAPISGRV